MPSWMTPRRDETTTSPERPYDAFLGRMFGGQGGGGGRLRDPLPDPQRREVRRPDRPDRPDRHRNDGPDLSAWDMRRHYRPGGGGGPDFDPGSFGLDPGHDYGARRGNFLKSGAGRAWIEQNPEAYYQLRTGQRGMPTDSTTAYGRWLADQAGSLYADYQSAIGRSPNLTWQKYLSGVMGDLEGQYRTQPPELRGETSALVGGAQWLAF